ncbi:synaptonemal complex protein 2-like [Heterodontus francisci]|uniref:synaptonemal complex protein 2-like n=1 Tax=Heterodontus francisci TaxID=7792 RepID=UPI00355B119A
MIEDYKESAGQQRTFYIALVLQKLNMFEETVVQELKNLEEDTQTLKNLEEEALNFWKQQSLKFAQFFENQEQRMSALTSSPEDKLGITKEIQVNTTRTENEVQLTSMKETLK